MSKPPDPGDDDCLRLTLSLPGSHPRSEAPSQPALTTTVRTDSDAAADATAEAPQQLLFQGVSLLPDVYGHQRIGGTPLRRTSIPQRRPAVPERPSTSVKEERIEPPYPWAADRRAMVESLEILRARGIQRIWGEVVCKKCDGLQRLEVDVEEEFARVSRYFLSNRDTMHDRAPMAWYSPRLLDCGLCQQGDCVRPIVAAKKRSINWLFLLLTQTVGLCTLEQLKYFCKHNRKHRTGAKDRVLYLTYAGLMKQLYPSGPYDS